MPASGNKNRSFTASCVGVIVVIGAVVLSQTFAQHVGSAASSETSSRALDKQSSSSDIVVARSSALNDRSAAADLITAASKIRSKPSDMGDLITASGEHGKYMLVKKKPKHKKIKMEVFEPKMKYKKIKMKIPVKKMKKKKVKGYLVKKEKHHYD